MRGVYYLLFSFLLTFCFHTGDLSPGLLARRQFQIRPGGVVPEKLGGGVRSASQNPYFIIVEWSLLAQKQGWFYIAGYDE